MAKNSKTDNRSESIDVGGDKALALMGSFDGLYWALGARFDGVDVNPDGIVVRGFSTDAAYNPNDLVRDINSEGRRIQLYPTILWINGQTPAELTTAAEMTAFMTQAFKGAVEPGSTRTPKYIRDAFTAYKATKGIAGKRGPKPKTISLKNLSTLDVSVLRNANVDKADLEHLLSLVQDVIAETPDETPAEVATA